MQHAINAIKLLNHQQYFADVVMLIMKDVGNYKEINVLVKAKYKLNRLIIKL